MLQAFYEQNFFPEEIVIAGQLLTAKTMEMETRAFLHAFAELPGPSPTEKWYERPIGCGTPQSFMELVRVIKRGVVSVIWERIIGKMYMSQFFRPPMKENVINY